LTLLATTNNAAYQARAQTEARAMIPSAAEMADKMAGVRDDTVYATWDNNYRLLTLAQYYLATGDTNVVPAIEAFGTEFSRNQSVFGTTGHKYAYKDMWRPLTEGSDNGLLWDGYGAVNATELPGFLGVLLAREAGITNAYMDAAIERTSTFFAYYADKGTVPYGEHKPWMKWQGSNGKNALGAMALALQTNRTDACRYYSKMSTGGTHGRETGHTGPFFEYLWAPLAANVGGTNAMQSFFRRVSWHLDLQRSWDGSFVYDDIMSPLDASKWEEGGRYGEFSTTAAILLTYAVPYQKLFITGANLDPAHELSAGDIADAEWVTTYVASNRTDAELISDLENWARAKRDHRPGQRHQSRGALGGLPGPGADRRYGCFG
jgi:hypothetical protein